MTTSVYAISCGGDKNVLELVFFFFGISFDCCTTLSILKKKKNPNQKNPLNVCFTGINFMVCKQYLNKADT